MKVIKIKPMEEPKVVELNNELEDLQKEVGGDIQVVYPFEDLVGIICNDNGKLIGLPLNRSLRDNNGEIYDVISGDFLVVGLTEDDFCSLTDEQIIKYTNLYKKPELFYVG